MAPVFQTQVHEVWRAKPTWRIDLGLLSHYDYEMGVLRGWKFRIGALFCAAVTTGCDPSSILDRVDVAYEPLNRELEVQVVFKAGLPAPEMDLVNLYAFESYGNLRFLPASDSQQTSRLVLRVLPRAFDAPEIWRLPRERYTRKLPNAVSHGIGEDLAQIQDPDVLTESGSPRLFAYVDTYRRQWVGAALQFAAGQPSPIPSKTTIWLPLKRDTDERVILSVALYGAQPGVGPERASSVAAVFADYEELGRMTPGQRRGKILLRRVESLRVGK